MKNISDLFYQYYSDDVLQHRVAIAGLFASFLVVVWSVLRDRFELAVIFIYLSLILQFIVILYFILILYGSGKYKGIRLKLNIEDGHLTDVKTNYRNVALRDQTLINILRKLYKNNAFNIGKTAGINFYSAFSKNIHMPEEMTKKEKIEMWLKYDSGSGMGRFKLAGYTDKSVQINLISPFYGNCPRPDKTDLKECIFIKGYLTGIVYQILEDKCNENKVSCRYNETGCSFTFNR